MQWSVRLPRGAQFTGVAVLAYATLRTFAAFGRTGATFPDSLGYQTLSFAGNADRLWPVPLVYTIAHSMGARIAVQVLAGVAAWAWLAHVLTRRSLYPRAVAVSVLTLGLVPQVVRYDLAILSESLSVSLSVATVAATLDMVDRPSASTRTVWLVLLAAMSMVRPVHVPVLVACAVAFVLTALSAHRSRIMAAVLVVLSLWGVLLVRANRSTSELNLYTVLAERVITDDSRYSWFVSHGMPDVPGARNAEGYDFNFQLPEELATYVRLPAGQMAPALVRVGGMQLAQWVRHDGWSTYARFVAGHTSDTWRRITSLTPGVLDPPNDDFLPLESRTVAPRWLAGHLAVWAVVGLTALVALFARREGEARAKAIAAMGGCAILVHVATLLTSGIEHERHSVTVAVVLRVLVLAAVASMLTGAHRPSSRDATNADYGGMRA